MKQVSGKTGEPKIGKLFIVATPIGNREDISERALRILASVDQIAAEDTRHSNALLRFFEINTPTVSLHEHNEDARVAVLIEQMLQGKTFALISDAGTPLINDPGYRLVHAAHDAGIPVIPIPGPNAAITALSAAGLPTGRFVFEGFLPAKAGARRRFLAAVGGQTRTMVFYESAHRIVESLRDMSEVFGPEREAVIARELTKKFETIKRACLAELREWLQSDTNRQRGEFVVLVRGRAVSSALDDLSVKTMRVLSKRLPLRQASELASEISGKPRRELYQWALKNGLIRE